MHRITNSRQIIATWVTTVSWRPAGTNRMQAISYHVITANSSRDLSQERLVQICIWEILSIQIKIQWSLHSNCIRVASRARAIRITHEDTLMIKSPILPRTQRRLLVAAMSCRLTQIWCCSTSRIQMGSMKAAKTQARAKLHRQCFRITPRELTFLHIHSLQVIVSSNTNNCQLYYN